MHRSILDGKSTLENIQGCCVSVLAALCIASCSLLMCAATSVHLMYVLSVLFCMTHC